MFEKCGKVDFGWLAGLWLASALVFWPVLFGGQSFYFRDVPAYYYPQAGVTVQAVLEGRIPHWEPRIAAGYPFQADPHSMVFYPLALLLVLLPMPRGYDVFTFVHVPLAGTFTYLWLRRWRLSPPAAALGAAMLMFSGYSISVTCLTSLQRGLTWAPAALLAFEAYLATGGRRALAATALALAVQGSGTDPQYVLFTTLLLAVSPWMRPGPGRPPVGRGLCGTVGAGTLALLLLAYQYLPLAQLVAWSVRSGGLSRAEVSFADVDPVNLAGLVMPVSFPDPATPFFWASFHDSVVPFYLDLYWGLPALAMFLAAFGWFSGSRGAVTGHEGPGGDAPRFGRTVAVAAGIALVALLISLGEHTPIFYWLMKIAVPLRAFRFPGKYLLLTALTVPLVVALGFEGLRARQGRVVALFRTVAALAAAAAATMTAVVTMTGERLPRAFIGSGPSHLTDLAPMLEATRQCWIANLLFLTGLAAALVVLQRLAARGESQARLAAALVGFLTFGDLVWSTSHSFPVADDEVLHGAPLTAGRIEKPAQGLPPVRFVTFEPFLIPDSPDWTLFHNFEYERQMLTNLRGVLRGLNPVLESMSVRLQTEDALLEKIQSATGREKHRLSGAAGAQYAVSCESVGSVSLEKIPNVVPRAFIAKRASRSSASAARTTAALLALPGEASYEPASLEVVSTSPLAPGAILECEIEEYRSDSLRIRFDLRGRGMLVVLDAFYPNWHAFVDGAERPIHRVAGIFRGVEVAGGERVLEMRYEPLPFQVGAAVTLLALVLTAGLLVPRSPPPARGAPPHS